MHYRKLLDTLVVDMLPKWKDKFINYKDLKKQLNRDYTKDDSGNKRRKLTTGEETDSPAVADFVKLCEEEIHKFNNFVLKKQEWYLIKIDVLKGELIENKDSNEELMKIGKTLANLHGEIVLLLNYSWLNYTGLVKILKKHDKLSGALVRFPFIQKVLKEPFYDTDVLNNLVKKCDLMIKQVFWKEEGRIDDESSLSSNEKCNFTVPEELIDIKNMENTYMKLTLSALKVLHEIRSGSSTVNVFSSLQPMKEMKIWNQSLVAEVAK